ncbi:MAG: ATP-dependent Clp protease adaptor ClpS [Balneolales bacterium]
MPDFEFNEELEFEEQEKQQTEEPPKYKVILINDNYTTFDFVVEVLVNIFNKSVADAVGVTSDVHKKGSGLCGVYAREIAETKLEMVKNAGDEAGFPLRCLMEEE